MSGIRGKPINRVPASMRSEPFGPECAAHPFFSFAARANISRAQSETVRCACSAASFRAAFSLAVSLMKSDSSRVMTDDVLSMTCYVKTINPARLPLVHLRISPIQSQMVVRRPPKKRRKSAMIHIFHEDIDVGNSVVIHWMFPVRRLSVSRRLSPPRRQSMYRRRRHPFLIRAGRIKTDHRHRFVSGDRGDFVH